jgi:predicted Zn-dependent protease
MYINDRPLYVEDRDTGETSHVYGATQPSHQRPATAMSTFAFTETNQELHDKLLKTLTYHEAGHLLNEESEREYRDENQFGGGHCLNPDVMNGQNIMEGTRNRQENELYCEACTEEIKNGIKGSQ